MTSTANKVAVEAIKESAIARVQGFGKSIKKRETFMRTLGPAQKGDVEAVADLQKLVFEQADYDKLVDLLDDDAEAFDNLLQEVLEAEAPKD